MLRTWDIFDTLIARRCINPQNVFQIVEQVGKVKGFKEVRVVAEQDLIRKGLNYKFDDIYDNISKITKAPLELIEKLKKLEIDVEMDQVIPITENLNQVESGDVLISDMYLSKEIIRKMLDKVGLFVPVELIVTSNGKANGKLWNQLREQRVYLFHTGDNEISDVALPRKFDFDSSYTTLHRVNQFEVQVLNKDFNFGTYLRELRLKNPFNDEFKQLYWTAFVMNVGILILLIQLIDYIQKKYKFEYLGFLGRDTYYMYWLYKKFAQDNNVNIPEFDYLYYSRKLVLNSENDFKKYVSYKIKKHKSLLIDLFGTGMHLNKLRNDTKLDFSFMICNWTGYNNATRAYPQMKLSKNWVNIEYDDKSNEKGNLNFCVIDLEREGWPTKDHLELLNRATHNSPIRMKSLKVSDKIIPELIFTKVNDTENLDVFKTCMKEILNSKIQWPRFENIKDTIATLKTMILSFNAHAEHLLLKNQHFTQEMIDIFLRNKIT